MHIESISMSDFCLDAEDGGDLSISQRDGAMVENEFEIGLNFWFVIFNRGYFVNGIVYGDDRVDDFNF